MVKKVIAILDLSKTPDPDCIPAVLITRQSVSEIVLFPLILLEGPIGDPCIWGKVYCQKLPSC